MDPTDELPVVLFDGVCNVCDGTVDFLIRRDPAAHLRFAALQSDVGQRLMRQHGLDDPSIDSIVLVEGGEAYVRSTAMLRIVRHLRFPWRALSVLAVIPRILRDPLYAAFARRRYRWFGKRDACRMPTAADRERFLED